MFTQYSFPKHGKQQGYQTLTIYYFPSFGGKTSFFFKKNLLLKQRKIYIMFP
jgi:hypothetical protein